MKYILTRLILGIYLIFNSLDLMATHANSMEMNYRHVSDSTYEFTLILYRNCQGFTAGAPASLPLIARSSSLGFDNSNAATLTRMSTMTLPLTPLEIGACSGSPNAYCIEEYTYRGSFAVPGHARDWEFGAKLCCLPNEIDNVSSNTVLYVECGLNNLDFSDGNNSPFWHYRRPNISGFSDTILDFTYKVICESKIQNINQSATELDGDSMSYRLIHAQTYNSTTNKGDSASYNTGFSYNSPMPLYGVTSLNLNAVTGDMKIKPKHVSSSGLNMYLVPVRVDEYRNDTINQTGPVIVKRKVGYTTRNLTFIVEDSSDCFDWTLNIRGHINWYSNPVAGGKVNINCTEDLFRLWFTQPVHCSSVDKDGSFLLLTDSVTGNPLPIDSVTFGCKGGLVDSIRVYSDSIPIGIYYINMVKGNDGNSLNSLCHYEGGYREDSIKLQVGGINLPQIVGDPLPIGGNDTVVNVKCGQKYFNIYLSESVLCSSLESSGSDFVIYNALNPSQTVDIDSVYTVNCLNGLSNQISFLLNDSFPDADAWVCKLVRGNDGNRLYNICQQEMPTDSILFIERTPSLDLGPDTVYCRQSTVYLDGGFGFTSFLWHNNETGRFKLIDTSGIFWVQTKNNFGCKYYDTVIVNDTNPLANFIAIANRWELTLTNTSVNGQNYIWKFGDGNTSLLFEPQYTYSDTGWFEVCLDVSNYCDVSTFCDSVHITPFVGVRIYVRSSLKIYPNPVQTELVIENISDESLHVSIVNSSGMNVISALIHKGANYIDFSRLPASIYFVRIESSDSLEPFSYKVIKR